jgi:hypothetical protein
MGRAGKVIRNSVNVGAGLEDIHCYPQITFIQNPPSSDFTAMYGQVEPQ